RLWSIWLLRTLCPLQSEPPLRLNHRQRAPSRKILPEKVQAVELEISMQGPTTKSVCRSLLVTLTLAARSRKMAPSAPLRTVLESSVTPRVEATWMPPPPAYLAEPQVSIRLPLAWPAVLKNWMAWPNWWRPVEPAARVQFRQRALVQSSKLTAKQLV